MTNHTARILVLISVLPSLAEGEGGHDFHFGLSSRGHAVPSALSVAFKSASYCQLFSCCGILLSCRTQPNIITQFTLPSQFSTLVCLCHLYVHVVMYSEVCTLYIKCMNEFDIGCGISTYGRDHL
jgi:hypothetical protein